MGRRDGGHATTLVYPSRRLSPYIRHTDATSIVSTLTQSADASRAKDQRLTQINKHDFPWNFASAIAFAVSHSARCFHFINTFVFLQPFGACFLPTSYREDRAERDAVQG
jgi:hypothetical protein